MSENKIFNDPIHGTIKLEPFLVEIIDTPEFQRLRNIKQLGGTYHVYPEAQHNRFEHSIGTAHLAGKLLEHLRREQPKLPIKDRDVMCVKVAGLCHDLGHGPFSHLFDGSFLPRQGVTNWKHEKASCEMFDRIMSRIDADCKTLSQQDRRFVKEMINGEEMNDTWTHEGRAEDQSFLYEIISNETCGVDVDKWDYFARDSHHLGFASAFDHNRFIECTKVLEVDIGNQVKRRRICYRDKEVYNLYEMFHLRFSLHKRAYQHKAANAVEMMICDALCKANKYISVPGGGNTDGSVRECKMSESIENLDCFCNLDDRILYVIERSRGPDLEEARHILKRLVNGNKYRCIFARVLQVRKEDERLSDNVLKKQYGEEIMTFLESRLPNDLKGLLRPFIIAFNYGKKNEDPIQFCWFYSKNNEAKRIERQEVSSLLPCLFQEHWIQIFFTGENQDIDNIKNVVRTEFECWYKTIVDAQSRDLETE